MKQSFVFCCRTGNIYDVGYDSDLDGKYTRQDFDHVVDATGQCVIPGLIDGHTHPVWLGIASMSFP